MIGLPAGTRILIAAGVTDMRCGFQGLAACVLLLAPAPLLAAMPAPPELRGVLPSNVVPARYDLLLSPDAQALTFTARAGIDIGVCAATRQIVFNAAALTFDREKIQEIVEKPVRHWPIIGMAEITSVGPLATSHINFRGVLNLPIEEFSEPILLALVAVPT